MRRIYEFKVFDILKDKGNEEFLDMVKKENPNLYSKFLNIVGNKGLEIAKDKYNYYTPEEVNRRKEEERSNNVRQRTEERDRVNKSFLDNFKGEIDEVNEILKDSELKKLSKLMKVDLSISEILKGTKKTYSN